MLKTQQKHFVVIKKNANDEEQSLEKKNFDVALRLHIKSVIYL